MGDQQHDRSRAGDHQAAAQERAQAHQPAGEHDASAGARRDDAPRGRRSDPHQEA